MEYRGLHGSAQRGLMKSAAAVLSVGSWLFLHPLLVQESELAASQERGFNVIMEVPFSAYSCFYFVSWDAALKEAETLSSLCCLR